MHPHAPSRTSAAASYNGHRQDGDSAGSERVDAPAAGWSPTGRTTALLTVSGILVVSQVYLVLPLFDAMSRALGAPAGSMTWLVTSFGLAYAAGFLVSGPLSDRYGPRRVIIAGLIATAATTALVPLAPNLTTGCALRALQGLTAASYAPAAFSYIATRIAPERRAFAMTCATSGFLAAAVLVQVGAQAINAALGWQAAFLVFPPALVLAALLSRRMLTGGGHTGAATSVASAFAAIPRLLANPRLLALYGATTTLLGGFVTLYTGVSLAGPPSVRGSDGALLALRASALPAVVAVPLCAGVLARTPARVRLPGAMVAAALSVVAASVLGESVVPLAAVLLVMVAGIGVAAPVLVARVGEEGGAARGTAVALYASAMFVGASLGPLLAGALEGTGFPGIARAAAGVFVAGALLAYAAGRGRAAA